MAKRFWAFVIIVFAIVPVLVTGFVLGELILAGTAPNEEAYEVFGKQNTQTTSILLADTNGGVIMVCILKDENTHLISISPEATTKGEGNITFQSVYQTEGIEGLKKAVAKSLSQNIDGYLKVDFSKLSTVVDALGNVTMEGKTYSGQELENYLNKSAIDFADAGAQQNAVLAVGRRFCSAGFWKGQKAFRKFMKITETDLSVSALMKIGKALIPALEGKGLQSFCLSEEGKWIPLY